jgi:nucleoside-diphosphate-sugar epimerase
MRTSTFSYAGRKVLVTGGLGFIGSNLTIRLVAEGAAVTVVDPCVPGCGGNPANLGGAAPKVRILACDIGSPQLPAAELAQAEIVFNLAGEVSHTASMRMPERDLAINTIAQLRFLELLCTVNPGVRIIYAGTRQVYGIPQYLPVDEEHPINPVDFNGVHKYAATMYHLMLSRAGQLDACVLRLTNVYGPRLALDQPGQGVFSTFLRNLIRGQRLTVFGDGKQLRDPVFVEDVVDAFLLAGLQPKLRHRSYNLGGPSAISLSDIASIASEVAGVPPPLIREFPEDLKGIDIGSYKTDCTSIRNDLNWEAKVALAEGMARTLAWYSLPVEAAA